ncbi:MAG: hypothetical protein ISS93_01645 [Candidatus Aenigmarchaeota archaeon]|nr:hypothetical protein [Candidatus Aenigmarchaeota archaeon]
MECPKCGGGCLLSEEELIKVLEERAREAVKAVVKASYVCRACSERFSRLFVDDLAKRKRPPEARAVQYTAPAESQTEQETDPAENLKFF